jgi:hypothetical protein
MSQRKNAVPSDKQAPEQLRRAFLNWQCRVRQIATREADGRPNAAMMPTVTPAGADAPLGDVITLLHRRPEYAQTKEFQHFARKSQDPLDRREAIVKFLAESYYQDIDRFIDVLTASFGSGSSGARTLVRAKSCKLEFSQYSQNYRVHCNVWRLSKNNPLHEATFWHNLCFNPNMSLDNVILGFEPIWDKSESWQTT